MSPPTGLSRRKPARRSAPAANSARTLPAGGGATRQARTPARSRTRPTPGLSQPAPGPPPTRRRTSPAPPLYSAPAARTAVAENRHRPDMPATMLEQSPRTAAAEHARRGQLALALQEPFTVAIRLRANRQVAADADSFRAHIKQLLNAADREARRLGYDGEYVRLAVYAYIAFLDESVLNSEQPMFAAWPRQP